MGEERLAGRYVFTNETIKGPGCRHARVGAILMAASGVSLATLPATLMWLGSASAPEDRTAAGAGFVIGALFLHGGVALWRESVVRTWSIDGKGIAFQDAGGRSRVFRWHEVGRVRWDASGSRFQGNGGQISLPWRAIPRGQGQDVRQQIARSLPTFRLPVGKERRARSFLISLFYTALISFSAYVAYRGTIFLKGDEWWDQTHSGQVFKLIWAGLLFVTMIAARRLSEPMFWYDRQAEVSPGTDPPKF